ncbi:sporulation integral membrane protein YtvI [Thermoanaerobacterium thermosaccharolyticum]|uniref:sporulation integral membrane protein YtvI n=1 Tax=Thermoanaerobacterium thermosaccharolyticum TaxID=1517 RepID=UPI00279BC58C|nr:sporulation integral membrane protein YtvI [Thermoanaerobacterium thermosaccharolyticum]
MKDFLLRYQSAIKNVTIILAVIISFYLFVFKLIPFLMPFAVALFLAILIDPAVEFLEKKLKIPRGLSSAFLILLLIAIIGLLISLLVTQLVFELNTLAEHAPNYTKNFDVVISDLIDRIRRYYISLPTNISTFLENNLQSILNNISIYAKNFAAWILGLATKLPNFFFMSLITIVSTFFLSKDKWLILNFIKRQFPSNWALHAENIKGDLFQTLIGFIRAEITIMFITFMEVSIGLTIIGFDYAFLLGLLVSFIDILPVLGSGSVLVPWALYNIFTKNYLIGIYLLILYGIVTIVRQMIEPKIVGQSIGLHPLVTLLSMFIGAKLFGGFGLIMGPVFVVVFKTFQKSGIIPSWK